MWGTLDAEGDSLVVRLSGWRAAWAVQRTLRVPLSSVVRVAHEPAAHQVVSVGLRHDRRVATRLFKLGSQHGRDGWSFWACGGARNAVIVETTGVRYRFIIVEVADPAAVVEAIRQAAGLPPTQPQGSPGAWRRPARSGRGTKPTAPSAPGAEPTPPAAAHPEARELKASRGEGTPNS